MVDYSVDELARVALQWLAFETQRLTFPLSMAQEAAETLGLSVAADPRSQ